MKKVILAISAVAFSLVSCTKFEAEPEVDFEKAAAPVVSVNVTGDNSISFTVTPGSNTGYYAYAVFKGEVDAATIDASALLAGKASGNIKAETFNVAKKASVDGTVEKLASNTAYTVAAVASSKETQTLSKVVALTVTTTDGTAPQVVLSDSKTEVNGKTITYAVAFDDPVTLTDTAAFVVRVYAKNVDGGAPYYILSPVDQVAVPAENVSTSGSNVVVVEVPEEAYAPGAYTALFIGPGSVVNALGSCNAAFTANMIIVKGDYTAATTGLYAKYQNVSFDLASPVAEGEFIVFEDPADVAVELGTELFGDGNALYAGKGDITATAVKESNGRKVEYSLQKWAASGSKITLGLDEATDAGTNVSYSIPAGIVEDVYGNQNSALDLEDLLFCPVYNVADLIGSWTYQGTSVYGSKYNETGAFVFAASDNAAEGNVMLTAVFDTPCDHNVYCYFNQKELTLTIPGSAPFYDYVNYQLNEDKTDYVYDEGGKPIVSDAGFIITGCANDDYVVFDFAEGKLSNPSDAFGYYYYSTVDPKNNSGWGNRFSDITLTKDSATPSPVPAKKIVRKLEKGNKVLK